MKKICWILLLFPVVMYSQIESKNFIDQNYIQVTGKSEMRVTPDLIYLKILISDKDKSNKSLSERENLMVSKLKEIGIDISKDLMIKDLSSNFKSYLFAKNDILLSKEYQLLVKDGKTVSKVFIELEKIGISNVSIEKVENSNIEKLRKEVKIEAIKAAKIKAESLVNAIGQNLGRAIYIQEQDFDYGRAYQKSGSNIMIRGLSSVSDNLNSGSQLPDIDFEKIILEYSILCRFDLK